MTFTPTSEQQAIIEAARDTADNLIISALAGAAKTSTLVLIAEALPKVSILSIAFNKKIADEMKARLPGNCTAKTLNSLGHSVWRDSIGKWPQLDTRKTYRIVKQLIESLDNPKEKTEAYDRMADIMRNVDAGKTAGYVPTGHYPNCKRLMDDDEFFESLEEEPSLLEMDILRAAALLSIKEAYAGTIDFNDQILMPTVFPSAFPQYPLVLVDEAQDLSALNHAMLTKFARKRLIAVGDECQAIYGFRGAHEESMALLEQSFAMRKLILSTSFRCPIAVVEEARSRAPHMQYPEWAKPGTVRTLREWGMADLPDDAVIICRNNAPLFSMAIKLLKNGRYPELVGNDIGKSLIKTLKKLGTNRRGKFDDAMPQAMVMQAIGEWEEAKLKKSRDPGKVHDQAACLRIFAEQGQNLGDAILYAERIMAMAGPVKLMTGHKSKGLEFHNVFFLDQHLLGKKGQELNLRYVIQTRAQETLTYIESNGFIEEDMEDVA